MGWFKKLTSPVWKSVRGVGRLLRGNVNEGLSDIGSGVKNIGPIVLGATGVGLPAAIAVGAAGGALEKGGQTNWHGKSMLGSAAGGALTGAGGHSVGRLGRSAVGRLLGGQPAASAAAAGTPTPKAPTGGAMVNSVNAPPPSVPMRVSSMGAAAPPSVATPVPAPPATSGVGRLLRGAGGAARDAAGWAGRNLGDIGQAAGGVATLYGAAAESGERDWMREMYESQLQKAEDLSPIYAELIRELMPARA